MANYPQKKSVYTDSYNFFNSSCSVLQLGFVNASGYMKVSPVNEEFRGKKAKRGAQMYNYDEQIFVSFNIEDLIILNHIVDSIEDGSIESYTFSRKINNSIKNLHIGRNLDADDGEEVGLDGPIQFYFEDLDREDPDGDPIIEIWFEFEKNKELGIYVEYEALKAWIGEAVSISTKTGKHALEYAKAQTQSKSSGNGGSRSRKNDDEDEEENERRPSRKRPTSKKSKPSNDDDDPAFNPDDEIPF